MIPEKNSFSAGFPGKGSGTIRRVSPQNFLWVLLDKGAYMLYNMGKHDSPPCWEEEKRRLLYV